MTNMHPQRPELNRVRWKNLEDYERKLANEDKELYVTAGGIFEANPPTIGHGVAVPKADYKIVVVLDAGQGVESVTPNTEVIAVIMPNEPSVKQKKWTEYLTTVDEVEKQSGYTFLSNVPANVRKVIEARVASIQ
jgi:endonuclease G